MPTLSTTSSSWLSADEKLSQMDTMCAGGCVYINKSVCTYAHVFCVWMRKSHKPNARTIYCGLQLNVLERKSANLLMENQLRLDSVCGIWWIRELNVLDDKQSKIISVLKYFSWALIFFYKKRPVFDFLKMPVNHIINCDFRSFIDNKI